VPQAKLKRKVVKKSSPIIKNKQAFQPYIPATKHIPEASFRAVLLGIMLAMILVGSTAYLGLKMGQTISASIPAAVISMAILRLFRKPTVLENNIVQTIASAGYVVTGGIIFTIPALIVMGYWQTFNYLQISFIAAVGGILGVLFSIPLRRALIIDEKLRFPEGVATAEVLKAGDLVGSKHNTGVGFLINGGIFASIIKFAQTGLHVIGESVHGWINIGGSVFGFSAGLSLSMIGAGYIVGMSVAINLLIGTAIAWLAAVPLYTFFSTPEAFGLAADASAFDWAMAVRSTKLRYIGVGTMIFGGLYALLSLIGPIKTAIASSFSAFQKSRMGQAVKVIRTEYDMPMPYVVLGICVLAVPVFIIFNNVLTAANLPISQNLHLATVLLLTVLSLLVGFICASIGGYMAGIVGSSANPLSGITIAAILAVSTTLMVLLGSHVTFGNSAEALSLAASVILIGGVVATAAALSCDNLQDLKSGHILGSTPWKQQATLMIGVIAGSIAIAPVLDLLYQAYGIGESFPRAGMDPTHALAAPQAMLMASVAKGVFSYTLDWPLVFLGMGIGLGIALIDLIILKRLKATYRLSVMAVALGLYLPIDVIMPLVIGGVINFMARRRLKSNRKKIGKDFSEVEAKVERQALHRDSLQVKLSLAYASLSLLSCIKAQTL